MESHDAPMLSQGRYSLHQLISTSKARTSRQEEPPNLTAVGQDHKVPPFLFRVVNL